ncbi:hypothetical protein AZF01_14685 [Martelella sp. AD-3]|nr:hypothetical protein AZF01_14685 [Martelella sp. AD-3]
MGSPARAGLPLPKMTSFCLFKADFPAKSAYIEAAGPPARDGRFRCGGLRGVRPAVSWGVIRRL